MGYYSGLCELYEAQGDYQQALAYYKRSTDLKADVFNAEKSCQLTEMQTKYDSEKKEKEAEIYRLKNVELARLNRHLQALNHEKDEIFDIASHDLKNPLTSIILTASIVENHFGDMPDEKIARFLQQIRESAERMKEIISKLLDLNAIEAGKINLEIKPIDLDSTIRSLIDNYAERARMKQISIHYEPPTTRCMIQADKGFLHQIFDNILSHAIKYSPIEADVFVRLSATNNSVCCEIQDTGPGLTHEDKQKLFHKFARLSAKPTGGEQSTGLGLSIVKKLVQTMEGTVWAESEGTGKGTRFFVKFPII